MCLTQNNLIYICFDYQKDKKNRKNIEEALTPKSMFDDSYIATES